MAEGNPVAGLEGRCPKELQDLADVEKLWRSIVEVYRKVRQEVESQRLEKVLAGRWPPYFGPNAERT